MLRWIRTGWSADEDPGDRGVTALWEVGADGWTLRSVELVGPDRRPRAAAALDEVVRERDHGDIRGYEARYGVLPEARITDWQFPHEHITAEEFEQTWRAARQALGPRP